MKRQFKATKTIEKTFEGGLKVKMTAGDLFVYDYPAYDTRIKMSISLNGETVEYEDGFFITVPYLDIGFYRYSVSQGGERLSKLPEWVYKHDNEIDETAGELAEMFKQEISDNLYKNR